MESEEIDVENFVEELRLFAGYVAAAFKVVSTEPYESMLLVGKAMK